MTTIVHALTPAEASTICAQLHTDHGITVTAHITGGVTYIHPGQPLDTRQRVKVLRAFEACTDAFAWHPTTDQPLAVAS
jgi:hypothetical protein